SGRYIWRTTASDYRTRPSEKRPKMPLIAPISDKATRTEDAMPYYRRVGDIPPKRHTQFRQPDGSLYAEELMGQEGFSSDSSLLYHRFLPTAIVAAEAYAPPAWTRTANLPLKPRHFQTHKLDVSGADPILGRQHLMANDDCRISYVVADRPSPL